MVLAIITLYVLSTIDFSITWFFTRFGFIDNRENAQTVFKALLNFNTSQWKVTQTITSVSGIASTFIADGVMVRKPYHYLGNTVCTKCCTDLALLGNLGRPLVYCVHSHLTSHR